MDAIKTLCEENGIHATEKGETHCFKYSIQHISFVDRFTVLIEFFLILTVHLYSFSFTLFKSTAINVRCLFIFSVELGRSVEDSSKR